MGVDLGMSNAIAKLLAAATLAGSLAVAGAAEPWRVETVKGETLEPFTDPKTKALVAVFIATDCPVANYFQPTLRRLQEKYGPRGVAFVFFHPDPTVSRDAARKHAEEYGIVAAVALDPKFVAAKRLAAEVTPEAFVIARDGSVKYRGRVNDMYAAFGKKRRAPRNNDLDDAIGAVLDGKTISSPKTKPIGCYIPYPRPIKDTK